jgi:hypothetical protein
METKLQLLLELQRQVAEIDAKKKAFSAYVVKHRREQFAADPELKKKAYQYNCQRRKERYHTDDEYREKAKTYQKSYYQKKRACEG